MKTKAKDPNPTRKTGPGAINMEGKPDDAPNVVSPQRPLTGTRSIRDWTRRRIPYGKISFWKAPHAGMTLNLVSYVNCTTS